MQISVYFFSIRHKHTICPDFRNELSVYRPLEDMQKVDLYYHISTCLKLDQNLTKCDACILSHLVSNEHVKDIYLAEPNLNIVCHKIQINKKHDRSYASFEGTQK